MICVYKCFHNTLGLVLICVFQYFYLLLQKYWKKSDTFYFYLSNFLDSTFTFTFTKVKKFPCSCTFTYVLNFITSYNTGCDLINKPGLSPIVYVSEDQWLPASGRRLMTCINFRLRL